MTKRVLLTALAACAALAPAFAPAAAAATDTATADTATATGTVSNGIGWTAKPDAGPSNPMQNQEYCTLGVVGTDALGNKIAISAGHCVSAAAGGATDFPTAPRCIASGRPAPAIRSEPSPTATHGSTTW